MQVISLIFNKNDEVSPRTQDIKILQNSNSENHNCCELNITKIFI